MLTEIRDSINNHLTGRFLNNADKTAEITSSEEYVAFTIDKTARKLKKSFLDSGSCTEPIIKKRSPKHPKPIEFN
jgi:hypothetical protein